VLSVDAVHRYKPVRAVYDLVLQATGLPREQLLFVSSNYWDAAGAAGFGFPTCWVNRSDATPERLGVEPTTMVRTLAEIPTG
jgi:2-haloacid dehalogenase